jgi:hypothetical protein
VCVFAAVALGVVCLDDRWRCVSDTLNAPQVLLWACCVLYVPLLATVSVLWCAVSGGRWRCVCVWYSQRASGAVVGCELYALLFATICMLGPVCCMCCYWLQSVCSGVLCRTTAGGVSVSDILNAPQALLWACCVLYVLLFATVCMLWCAVCIHSGQCAVSDDAGSVCLIPSTRLRRCCGRAVCCSSGGGVCLIASTRLRRCCGRAVCFSSGVAVCV